MPLAEATACRLLRVLVAPRSVPAGASLPEARDHDAGDHWPYLAETLLADPALAVWCCGLATQLANDRPVTLGSVSRWLATDLVEHLLGTRRLPFASVAAHDAQQAAWRQLAEAGVAAARAVDAGRIDWESPALLAALVGQADRWLAICSDETHDGEGCQDPPGCQATRPGCLDAVLAGTVTARHPSTPTPLPAAPPTPTAPTTATPNSDWSASASAITHSSAWSCAWSVASHELASEAWSEALASYLDQQQKSRCLERDFERHLQRAKLAAMKELAYGAGHEINNPLANIGTRAQTLLRGEPDPERRRQLITINKQVFRAHAMIADMMLFANMPVPEWRELSLTGLVDRLCQEIQDDAADRAIEILRAQPAGGSADLPAGDVMFWGDENQLLVALRAIAQNALESVGQAGIIRISAGLGPADLGGSGQNGGGGTQDNTAQHIVVEIADNGPGIAADVRPFLFDPFFSGREAGRGLGFGLSKAWQVVQCHEGRLEVSSSGESGATFRVILPTCPSSAAVRK